MSGVHDLMSVRGCDLCGDTCSDRLHRYGTEMLAVCSLYAVYGFMLGTALEM